MLPTSDFFAGLGGFSEGALQAGADVRYAANHNDLAVHYHERNHPEVRVVQQDLQQADMGDIGEPQLLVAGPSCQGFSSASNPSRAGTGGNGWVDASKAARRSELQRSTMWAVTAAAEVARPRHLLVENSPRVLKWELLPAWTQALRLLGYQVQEHVLHAPRYGTASDRRRAIITATLDPEPIVLQDSWGDHRATLRDCLTLDPDEAPEGTEWIPVSAKPQRTRDLILDRQTNAGLRDEWGLLNNVGDGVRMRSLDDRSPTLTTKSGGQLMLVLGDRTRMLSNRELANLMGFPQDYVLPTDRADAAKLIGNAIPVPLAKGIVEQVLNR